MKKALSLLLTLAMLLSLSVTVFANDSVDETPDGLTITLDKSEMNLAGEVGSHSEGLIATVTGSDSGDYAISWSVDNPDIVELTPSKDSQHTQCTIKIKGGVEGNGIITAAVGEKTATCAITVRLDEYTITFNSMGGSDVESQKVKWEGYAVEPEAPTKEGYTFFAWYTSQQGAEKQRSTGKFNFELGKISKDYTLFASWKINKYTVKFVNGGTELSSAEYDYGTAAKDVTVPANPSKASVVTDTTVTTYAFKGWSPELAEVTADATYTAVFEETVTSLSTENTEVTKDEDAGTTTTTVTTGTDSSVATTVNDETGEVTKVVETSGATTTTTEYGSVTVDVTGGTKTTDTTTKTVAVDGGTTTVTTTETATTTTTTTNEETATTTYQVATTTTTKEQVNDGAETTKSTVGTTQAVNLKSEEQEAGTKVSDDLPSENNTVKTAVTTVANRAANTLTADKVDVAAIAKAELAKVDDAEDKNVKIDVVLTLKTELVDYTVAETEDETPATEAASLTYDVTPMMQATVTIDDGAPEVKAAVPVSNDDLAAMKDASAKIKFQLPVPDSFVGTASAGDEVAVKHIHTDEDGNETSVEAIKGKIGGTASNYYVEIEVSSFSKFELIPAGKTYATVKFDGNGGSAVADQVVVSGETATQPTAPTRSGYTFSGWTLNGSAYNFATPVTADITLAAQWTQNSTGGYTGGGSYTPPTTTITDEETPLSDLPIFYVDVATGDWFRDAVAYVTNLGLMNGVGDQHFDPNANTTRGMVAVVMMRLAQGEAIDGESFFDVADDAYYAEAAAWAVENGVFVGYDDGSFRGEVNISREQFAAVLYRYALAKGYDVSGKADIDSFADSARVSGYAADAMAWAVESGIIDGIGDNLLDPTGNATRAQLATMLMRFSELTKDTV